MKYMKILLIIVSVLSLTSASLTICKIIPPIIGIVLTLLFIAAELVLHAVSARAGGKRYAFVAYMAAAVGALLLAAYAAVSSIL